jgi:hypothetical protein
MRSSTSNSNKKITNTPNNNPIRALVMSNMMLKFHNDSCNFAQVRAPAMSRSRFTRFQNVPPIGQKNWSNQKNDRVFSPDKHTIKIWWNFVRYWGSTQFLCFSQSAPIWQTVHQNTPNKNPIWDLAMGNMMLKFQNDSCNFSQVRAPATSRSGFRLVFRKRL